MWDEGWVGKYGSEWEENMMNDECYECVVWEYYCCILDLLDGLLIILTV